MKMKMTYQDIQDYASELASCKLGFGSVAECWDSIRSVFYVTDKQELAIVILCRHYMLVEQGEYVDWDSVDAEVLEMLNA